MGAAETAGAAGEREPAGLAGWARVGAGGLPGAGAVILGAAARAWVAAEAAAGEAAAKEAPLNKVSPHHLQRGTHCRSARSPPQTCDGEWE